MTAPGEDSADGSPVAESGGTRRQDTGKPQQNTVERQPRADPDGPPPRRATDSDDGEGWMPFVRDLVVSLLAVALFGSYLFAISGVWPPLVAVESGSMNPNMEKEDLVFVMENERFTPAEATGETGVVTAQTGRETGYSQFGGYGDVIVFTPDGDPNRTPVIHRAKLWVEEGENWCDRANEAYLGNSNACEEAPHAGFITKGDANGQYDQVRGISKPVKPEWVVGTAEVQVPYLGWFRLQLQ
jgi:signal peptidase